MVEAQSLIISFKHRLWSESNPSALIIFCLQGLQGKIELVPIDLDAKPTWYKDVYPPAKVPALEHTNQVIGESLDLLKYLDTHFDGPSLFPDDPAKKEFAEELFAYSGTLNAAGFNYLKGGSEADMSMFFDLRAKALFFWF